MKRILIVTAILLAISLIGSNQCFADQICENPACKYEYEDPESCGNLTCTEVEIECPTGEPYYLICDDNGNPLP